jgi:penicillin-binding protein 1A
MKFYPKVWLIFGGCILFALLFFTGVSYGLLGEMPDIDDLENPKNALSSEIIGSDGQVIGSFFLENRTNVTYSEISPNVYHALIATEDIRFYTHSGIDFRGTVRAFASLGSEGGASTITQQLSKNLFSRFERPRGKIGRLMQKLKEWVIAVELEKRYTKNEILVMYLNTVPFSGVSFGIDAASKEFFNKRPHELDINEAATLVGMLKANWKYNPKYNTEHSQSRRNVVLNQMVKYDYLSRDSFELLKDQPIVLRYRSSGSLGMAPYFKTHLGLELKDWCAKRGYNLYRSGLKIYTTLDSKMQLAAEAAVSAHLSAFQPEFIKSWGKDLPWRYISNRAVIPNFIEDALKRTERYKELKNTEGLTHDQCIAALKKPVKMSLFTWSGDKDTIMSPYDSMAYIKKILHAGFIAVEPSTGHVKAWVGGINHQHFKYDHVNRRAKRQVGSTFKPIIYATAIDINKFTPCTEFPRERTVFISGGKEWSPKNFDGKEGGIWPIWKGLALSDNLITAQIMKSLGENGPDLVVQFSERVGIDKNQVPRVPSISLGTVELSPFEMASAYSAFVNKGLWIEPTYITRIEDKDGTLIEEFSTPKHDQVLDEEKAYIMLQLLKRVVDRGTAAGLKGRYELEGDIGGKTGTTQGAADGWFMGVTNDLVCAAWVGADDPTVRVRYSSMGQGSKMAMPIFGEFMKTLQKDKKIAYKANPFEAPANMDLSALFDCAKENKPKAKIGGDLNVNGLGD